MAQLLPYVTGALAFQPTTANLVATPAAGAHTAGRQWQRHRRRHRGHAGRGDLPDAGRGQLRGVADAATSWALHNFWVAQVGLSWTLWDWGRSIYGYRSARNLAPAQVVGVRTAAHDVVLQVRLAFFGSLAADEQLTVAADAVHDYQAHLAQTRGLHDAGLRTGIDVATAESALPSPRSRCRARRPRARRACSQMQVALGEDRWRGWRLVATDASLEEQPGDDQRGRAPLDDLAVRALGQRPELAQLRLQERGFSAAVASARGGYLPALSLGLDPIWAGPDWASLTGNFTVTIALAFPLDGMSPWLVHGQSREAEGNLVVARAGERASRDSIRQELVDARTRVHRGARSAAPGAHADRGGGAPAIAGRGPLSNRHRQRHRALRRSVDRRERALAAGAGASRRRVGARAVAARARRGGLRTAGVALHPRRAARDRLYRCPRRRQRWPSKSSTPT